jgi:hypothetical protein
LSQSDCEKNTGMNNEQAQWNTLVEALSYLLEWARRQPLPARSTPPHFAAENYCRKNIEATSCGNPSILLGHCVLHRPWYPVCNRCYQRYRAGQAPCTVEPERRHEFYEAEEQWIDAENCFFAYLWQPRGTFEPLEPDPEREWFPEQL